MQEFYTSQTLNKQAPFLDLFKMISGTQAQDTYFEGNRDCLVDVNYRDSGAAK